MSEMVLDGGGHFIPAGIFGLHASFCLLSFLFFSFSTVFVPNLFWCDFLYLVTTAGFVADQLIM